MSNQNPINIRTEILSHIESLHCKWQEESGIVRVTTPSGEHWDFTLPLREDEQADTGWSPTQISWKPSA